MKSSTIAKTFAIGVVTAVARFIASCGRYRDTQLPAPRLAGQLAQPWSAGCSAKTGPMVRADAVRKTLARPANSHSI